MRKIGWESFDGRRVIWLQGGQVFVIFRNGFKIRCDEDGLRNITNYDGVVRLDEMFFNVLANFAQG